MPNSDASDGALDVFMAIANAETANVTSSMARPPSVRAPPRIAESDEDDEDDDHDDDGDGDEDGDNNRARRRNSSPFGALSNDGRTAVGDDDDCSVASEQTHPAAPPTAVWREEENDDARSTISRATTAAAAAARGNGFSEYMRNLPPMERSKHELEAESIEKSTMLADLERLKAQGAHLSRNWTMQDDVDDMSFELKRLTLQMDEANNVSMMQNGLQLACTGIEMLSKRFKILELDGWSQEVCRDMDKYQSGLGRIYRKYWRKSHSSSPEADILMSLVGSMGMYHMRRTVTRRVFSGGGGGGRRGVGGGGGLDAGGMRDAFAATASRARPAVVDADYEYDDDDEGLPP